ncbi:MAG: hypothetical protein ACKVOH_06595, partial [Chlamydiales bacterium]
LNRDPAQKLRFIQYTALRNLTIYPHRIASNAFSLMRNIHHTQAASATVDPSFHPLHSRSYEDKTSTVRCFYRLMTRSRDRVLSLSGGADECLMRLIKDHEVIVDAAGTFRDMENIQICQCILENRGEIEGVLIFDGEGNEFIFERSCEQFVPKQLSQVPGESIFIFIPKHRSTGTDVKEMSVVARGCVTMDRYLTSALAVQGIGRFRNPGSQTISLALHERDLTAMRVDMMNAPMSAIILHLVVNQGLVRGRDYFQSIASFLDDEIASACEAMILQRTSSSEGVGAKLLSLLGKSSSTAPDQGSLHLLEDSIITRTEQDVMHSLGVPIQKVPAKEAIAQLEQQMIGPLERRSELRKVLDFGKLRAALRAFVCYERLPHMLDLSQAGQTASVVQAQHHAVSLHEQQTTVTLASESQGVSYSKTPRVPFIPAPAKPWNGNYHALCQGRPDRIILGVRCYSSPNLNHISTNGVAEQKLLKRVRNILLIAEHIQGPYKLLFLDLHDTHQAYEYMMQHKEHNAFLLNILGVWAQEGEAPLECNPQKNPYLFPIAILHKLRLGDPVLSATEVSYLRGLPSAATIEFRELIVTLKRFWPDLNEQLEKILSYLR